MSSSVDSGGIIAAAVVLPVAAAYGAGWLAWKSGKLLIEANRAINRQIEKKKQEIEEMARHRRITAVSAHEQMVEMCAQILEQLNLMGNTGSVAGTAEIEQLKYELEAICKESLPEETEKIESVTTLGYLRLEKAIQKQNQIAAMTMDASASGLYRGLSVADLMDDLRVIVGTIEVQVTEGRNIEAADPEVLERKKLNVAFAEVTASIVRALDHIELLADTYGLNTSGSAWFHSCFNGVDAQVEALCRPTTSNEELKKGIRRLQDAVRQYELLVPSIEKDLAKMDGLYRAYVDACGALGEAVQSKNSFKSAADVEERLAYLDKRAEKAAKCAEICQQLGQSAYICYAWDQELKALGYTVRSRKSIVQMAEIQPTRAKAGDRKIPFYEWNEEELTQLYSIGSQCALQVIVHDDGAITMQTIAETDDGETVDEQRRYCAQLHTLHERLRENWFIIYDYQETADPEEVTTVARWRTADGFGWKKEAPAAVSGTGRKKSVDGQNTMQKKE